MRIQRKQNTAREKLDCDVFNPKPLHRPELTCGPLGECPSGAVKQLSVFHCACRIYQGVTREEYWQMQAFPIVLLIMISNDAKLMINIILFVFIHI